MKKTIDKCTDCSICIENCPAGSICRVNDTIVFNETCCIHCNMCVETCANISCVFTETDQEKSGEVLTVGIIGCGVSGIHAANELRIRGHKVTILTRDRLPIDRPNMCDYFMRKGTNLNDVIESGVVVLRNTMVTGITEKDGDVSVTTNNGFFHFDRCIIATGGKVSDHLNGSQQKNVFSFWDYENVKKMVDYVKNHKAESAIIIGGGSVGIEAAFFLSDFGCTVTIIEKAENLLAGRMDPVISAKIIEEMIKRSITCIFNETVTGICTEGVRADKKVYQADVIVITGSRPDVECFRSSGFQINKGIVVNEKMETTIPNIYAAGDITEYNGITSATVKKARTQAVVAANNICGNKMLFKEEPACDVLKNIPLSIVVSGEKNGERIIRKKGDTIRIVYRDENNRISGYQSVNDREGMSGILYNAIKRHAEVSDAVVYHEHSIFTIKKERFQ